LYCFEIFKKATAQKLSPFQAFSPRVTGGEQENDYFERITYIIFFRGSKMLVPAFT
jgi:hypothetical protein